MVVCEAHGSHMILGGERGEFGVWGVMTGHTVRRTRAASKNRRVVNSHPAGWPLNDDYECRERECWGDNWT
jgi:hypothetical protein